MAPNVVLAVSKQSSEYYVKEQSVDDKFFITEFWRPWNAFRLFDIIDSCQKQNNAKKYFWQPDKKRGCENKIQNHELIITCLPSGRQKTTPKPKGVAFS